MGRSCYFFYCLPEKDNYLQGKLELIERGINNLR